MEIHNGFAKYEMTENFIGRLVYSNDAFRRIVGENLEVSLKTKGFLGKVAQWLHEEYFPTYEKEFLVKGKKEDQYFSGRASFSQPYLYLSLYPFQDVLMENFPLQQLFDHIDARILIIDEGAGRIRYNKSAKEAMSIGDMWWLYEEEKKRGFRKQWEAKEEMGITIAWELVIRHPYLIYFGRDITLQLAAFEEIKQQNERLKGILKILQYPTQDEEAFLKNALKQGLALTHSQYGYIFHYQEKTEELILSNWATIGIKKEELAPLAKTFSLQEAGYLADAIRFKSPVVLNHYDMAPPLGHASLAHFLSVPIYDEEEIVAVVGLANKKKAYTETQVLQVTLLYNSLWDVLKKRKLDKLTASQNKLLTTIEAIEEGYLVLDGQGRIELVNEQAQLILRRASHELLGKDLREVFPLYEEGNHRRVCLGKVDQERPYSLHHHYLLIEGKKIHLEGRASPLASKDKLGEGKVIVFKDVSKRRAQEEAIQYLTFHDELTGLYNRAFFEQESRRLDTPRQYPLAVIMADVNNLKLTNDIFGHFEGDRLIKKAGEILQSSTRQEDLVARWGGDEFILLLPRTSQEQMTTLMDRITGACYQARDQIFLSIALGGAIKEEKVLGLDEVISKAEGHMYEEKQTSKLREKKALFTDIVQKLLYRSKENEEHIRRLMDLLEGFSSYLDLDKKDKSLLMKLARFHDVGNVNIGDKVLIKTSPLSEEEWASLKRHPITGARIASYLPELEGLSGLIYSHHEHWNGRGYPDGLAGEDIPYLDRVFQVVDAYEVMTRKPCYQEKKTPKEALEELLREAGNQFDPDLIESFATYIQGENAQKTRD